MEEYVNFSKSKKNTFKYFSIFIMFLYFKNTNINIMKSYRQIHVKIKQITTYMSLIIVYLSFAYLMTS